MVTSLRMGVEATIDCTLKLVYPDGEVELFVFWREQADFDLFAVFDFWSSSVVGKLFAFVFSGRVPDTMSSMFRASSDRAAARAS